MITRRSALLAGGVGLLIAHHHSHGQPAAILRRVGLLALGSEASVPHLLAALKQGLLDLGWHEGKRIEYRVVYWDGDVGAAG